MFKNCLDYNGETSSKTYFARIITIAFLLHSNKFKANFYKVALITSDKGRFLHFIGTVLYVAFQSYRMQFKE